MACVNTNVGVPQRGHELPTRKGIRCFYIKMNQVIGYSNGEETYYVYAEWAMNGSVHGRPITAAELVKKGASREVLA